MHYTRKGRRHTGNTEPRAGGETGEMVEVKQKETILMRRVGVN